MSDKHPHWLIVHTRPGCEFLAAYHLRRQGFRVWHWHQQRQQSYQRRGKTVTMRWSESYFSRYLFVRQSTRVGSINETTGVSTIIYGKEDEGDKRPLMIPDVRLRWLAEDLCMEEDGCVPLKGQGKYPELPKGATFKVKDGPFISFLATVKDAVPLDHRTRFKAYIDIFGRETEVEFDQRQIGEMAG